MFQTEKPIQLILITNQVVYWWLQGGETIDSNENLTEGIEETQENNQVNANDIKKEVEGKSLRNHGWNGKQANKVRQTYNWYPCKRKNQNSAGKGEMCSKTLLLNTTVPKTLTEIKEDQHMHTERVPWIPEQKQNKL